MAETRDFITSKTAIEGYFAPLKNILIYNVLAGGRKEPNPFSTTILEVSEGSFLVQIPPSANPERVRKGNEFAFRMYPLDGFYVEFYCRVLLVLTSDQKFFMRVSFPKEITRVQRRDSYRISLNSDAKISLKEKDGTYEDPEAKILDVSVGGALILSELNPAQETNGVLLFHSPEDPDSFEFNFRVKRVKETGNSKVKTIYSLGVEFFGLTEIESQRLSRLITKLQILERSKIH